MVAEDKTGRERKERLRARRDEMGLAQVSGWVPKNRRPYAREVLAALAQGANSLPPDPEQAAALKAIQEALEAAQAEAATARTEEAASAKALLVAQEREHVLIAELDVARAEIKVAMNAKNQAEIKLIAEAEISITAVNMTLALVEYFQKTPGIRGKIVRWLTR